MSKRLALLLMTIIGMGLIAPVFAWEMERPSYDVQTSSPFTATASQSPTKATTYT